MYLRSGVAGPIGGGGAGTGALLIGELDYAEQGELLWTQEYGCEMDYCVICVMFYLILYQWLQ